MISKKEKRVLATMRNNSRQSAAKIANKLQIPTSVVLENIDGFNTMINKYSSLINFTQVGFPVKIVIATNKAYLPILLEKKGVNNLYLTNQGVIAEILFQTIKDKHDFIEQVGDAQIYDVIEELKREEFRIT
ncbi:hypothetical protein H8D36_05730 [archaeon]|nr:hypothetical protein [archaeon]MBL7057047.1 hypothetical protein [Candidatus Woesearchaeota archaeon]